MPSQPTTFKYFAFISYSRKDSKAAAWLQKRLEWFRFPVKLVPEDRRPPKPPYIRPIYRDKTNLPVTIESYWKDIRLALEESRFLIVLCSPHSAASKPVEMEVSHFLATHNHDASHLVPIIVSGNVTSRDENAAFCPTLRSLGESLIERTLPTMVPDGDKDERDTWEQGFVSLVSYLLQLDRTAIGDHIRRETKRQATVLRLWLLLVGALGVIAAVAGLMAYKNGIEATEQRDIAESRRQDAETQRNEAIRQRREADTNAREAMAARDGEKKQLLIVEHQRDELAKADSEQKRLLHKASMASLATGLLAWEEDSVGMKNKERKETVGGKSKWHEAVAHFSHALELEPGNNLAATWLYSTLLNQGGYKRDWPVWAMQHENQVNEATFSPDGTKILTASGNNVFTAKKLTDGYLSTKGYAQIWDITTGKAVGEPLVSWTGDTATAVYSPDGSLVLTAADKVAIWNAETREQVGQLLGESDAFRSASFSPDGRKVITIQNETARLWDVATRRALPPLEHEDYIVIAKFSPDSTKVITGGADATAKIWNSATGKLVCQPLPHQSGSEVMAANFSPDGKLVITACGALHPLMFGYAQIWDASTGKALGEPMRHERPVLSAEFSPDGTMLLTASLDTTARIWNVYSSAPYTHTPVGQPIQHGASIYCARFSPDGMTVVTAGVDHSAKLWSTLTGEPRAEPFRHNDVVWSANFSGDGSKLVTSSGDGTARVWNIAGSARSGLPMRLRGSLSGLRFNQDGTKLMIQIAEAENAVISTKLYETPTGSEAHGRYVTDVTSSVDSLSADGSTFIVTDAEDAANYQVWNVEQGRLCTLLNARSKFPDGFTVGKAEFNRKGNLILTVDGRGSAQLWEAATGKRVGRAMVQEGLIKEARYSFDGRRIATWGQDRTVNFWDGQTGEDTGVSLRHDDQVHHAEFGSDGSLMVTISSNHVWIWRPFVEGRMLPPVSIECVADRAVMSPDGMSVTTIKKEDDGVFLRRWDLNTGKPLADEQKIECDGLSTTFSENGARMAVVNGMFARVYDTVTGLTMGEPLWLIGPAKPDVESPDGIAQARLMAELSPDGSKLALFSSGDNRTSVGIWSLAPTGTFPSMEKGGANIVQFGYAHAGLTFSTRGPLQAMSEEDRQRILSKGSSLPGEWGNLARWLASPGSNRTIDPTMKVTAREAAERERDFGTWESLVTALAIDPTVPLVRLKLATLLEKTSEHQSERFRELKSDPTGSLLLPGASEDEEVRIAWGFQGASMLRRYDLDHLPDDAEVWARAALELLNAPAKAQVGLGTMSTSTKEEARKAARRAASLNPDLPLTKMAVNATEE